MLKNKAGRVPVNRTGSVELPAGPVTWKAQTNRLAEGSLHSFPPLAQSDSTRLLLGSMPGIASLQAGQYYAHPRNLFWPLMQEALGIPATLPYPERCGLLLKKKLALWDVLAQCQRPGSLDSAIVRDSMRVNDFSTFLERHDLIRTIFFNGAKAEQVFLRQVVPKLPDSILTRLDLRRLPSTSPANASIPYTHKLLAWRQLDQA